MKAALALFLALWLLATPCAAITPLTEADLSVPAPAACLIDFHTGTLLYEKDAHSRRHIASVTKVMTMLLIMEALESGSLTWDTSITASANAASMGGSQIWLEEGETMTVSEMLKCIAVVSANDCSVAMAEHLCGTEEAFVRRMNERAVELGLENTHFTNCTGLFDNDDHYSSAYDVAVMARTLISHQAILEYTTIWIDTARNGEFGLSNTNRLIHSFEGATGLKTGFTDGAMYCLAATAQRGNDAYVAAVLGADTSANRFDSAATLLSYGFANYTLADATASLSLPPIPVALGQESFVQPVLGEDSKMLMEKSAAGLLRCIPTLPQSLTAPIEAQQIIGTLQIYSGDHMIREIPLVPQCAVPAMSLWQLWLKLVQTQLGGNAV